jgi:hypothetical protein
VTTSITALLTFRPRPARCPIELHHQSVSRRGIGDVEPRGTGEAFLCRGLKESAMAGHLQRLLTLFAVVASASAAFAQSGRPWVDPPVQDGAQPQTSAPAATPNAAPASTADPKPAAALPGQAPADEQTKQSTESARPQTPSSDPSASSGGKSRTSQKAETERRAPIPSPRAASRKSSPRTEAIASRRGSSTRGSIAASRSEGRSTARSQGTRLGRVQAGPGNRLEVMNLRTIQFPDGRRVTILTRPNPDATSGLIRPPGY